MEGLPKELRTFIAAKIESIAQLELLLLLRANPQREFTASEVSRSLYTSVEPTARYLSALVTHGLLAGHSSAGALSYRYSPQSDELARSVDLLAKMYQEKPVAVTTAIYAGPADRIQVFADSFRLRKDEK